MPESVEEDPPKRLVMRFVTAALTIVIVWLVFGVILPSIADYEAIWDSVTSMSLAAAIALLVFGLAIVVLMALVLPAGMRGLRLWPAIMTQPMSVAVGAVVPGAVAPARAVFLRPFGITAAAYTRSYAAAALGTTLCVLLMPVIGLVIFLVVSPSADARGMRTFEIIVCLAALVIAALLIVMIRSVAVCRWIARAGASLVGKSAWLSAKLATNNWEGAAVDWQRDTNAILRKRRARLSAATLAVYWTHAALMVTCMYACGLPIGALPIATGLATFTVARLLLAVPLTPGGVGVLELGYSAIFGGMVAAQFDDSVVAGVLLYRALTYILPVFIGGILILLSRLHPRPEPSVVGGLAR